jgi:esterase/lipase superfamily enzyme
MRNLQLYFATNRKHEGPKRWKPIGYGNRFSDDGEENLRFGKLTLPLDENVISRNLQRSAGGKLGRGCGNKLAKAITQKVKRGEAAINAFPESLDPDRPDTKQAARHYGSLAMFTELKKAMMTASDVLVFIHGFNVSWSDAVGSALALQESLNQSNEDYPTQDVLVVLFSWPSDGKALPFVSYSSDRGESRGSGAAMGRGLLKLRDFVGSIPARAACHQNIHLACHSMGNYVLQNTLPRLFEYTPGRVYPRLFKHIFLCSPDVDDDVLEPDQAMGDLHQLAAQITIYHNRGDTALWGSDYTKGNPDRLGQNGVARPALIHQKVHQVDCSPIVSGFMEHSYYLDGRVNSDIRMSLANLAMDDERRTRTRDQDLPNIWKME